MESTIWSLSTRMCWHPEVATHGSGPHFSPLEPSAPVLTMDLTEPGTTVGSCPSLASACPQRGAQYPGLGLRQCPTCLRAGMVGQVLPPWGVPRGLCCSLTGWFCGHRRVRGCTFSVQSRRTPPHCLCPMCAHAGHVTPGMTTCDSM